MKKLFVIYLGGKHQQSLIELHDMRFVVAEDLQATYVALRQSWWGLPQSLHIDAWGILEYVENYSLSIELKPSILHQEKHLYFVNLGGYDDKQFTELHQNVFVIAQDDQEAKRKALAQISSWKSPHRDNLYEVEMLTNISSTIQENSHYYIHLQASEVTQAFSFHCEYIPI